ncbi:MAG: HDOD domain-containing protein [Deferribacteres bacterium]|nr:HDOD domain-containing protein [Deferribacteres bacterium]
MNDSLKSYVQQITKLPTVPDIARQILSLVDDNKLSVSKLENIVEKDPSIAAKILSVANSAFFGLTIPVTTINSAILRIGFNNVKNIALGISLMTVLDDGKPEHRVYYKKVFRHSAVVGVVSKFISEDISLNISEEMLVNGLLHDIGYLVLNRYFSDNFTKILNTFEEDGTLIEAERAVLDFTHSDIGTWLAEKWELPGIFIDTIHYHHAPSAAKWNTKHVAVVHLADYMTTANIARITEKRPDYPFDPAALDILGITEEDLKNIEAKIRDKASGNIFG